MIGVRTGRVVVVTVENESRYDTGSVRLCYRSRSLFTHPQKLSAFPYEVASAKPNLVGLSRTVVKAVFESQIHVLTYPWQAPLNRDA